MATRTCLLLKVGRSGMILHGPAASVVCFRPHNALRPLHLPSSLFPNCHLAMPPRAADGRVRPSPFEGSWPDSFTIRLSRSDLSQSAVYGRQLHQRLGRLPMTAAGGTQLGLCSGADSGGGRTFGTK